MTSSHTCSHEVWGFLGQALCRGGACWGAPNAEVGIAGASFVQRWGFLGQALCRVAECVPSAPGRQCLHSTVSCALCTVELQVCWIGLCSTCCSILSSLHAGNACQKCKDECVQAVGEQTGPTRVVLCVFQRLLCTARV